MVHNNFSLKNVYSCYLKCRANKRNSRTALEFEYNSEERLFHLWKKLVDGTYHPSESICFIVDKPKLREIFASSFEDRVVHHVLVSYLERIWEPKFIFDSYSCRVGKGTHLAVKRLQKFIGQISANGVRRSFYLHVDIKDFFMSVDKEILFDLISRHVSEGSMLDLAREIIFSDPTCNFVFLGRNINSLKNIPENKSLFNKENRCGLPIGNLTSQFFANVYLNPLDQYIKHSLKCRYYMRYCDDMILLDNSIEQLERWREDINRFASDKLKLRLNKKATHIASVNNGIDFLGFITRKNYILVRRRTIDNLITKIIYYNELLVKQTDHGEFLNYDVELCEKLLHTLNSYLGHFKFADTHKLVEKIFKRYSYLNEYFVRTKAKVIRNFNFKCRFADLAAQYWFFRRKYRGYLLFFQVGCFVEFYGRHAKIAQDAFGLSAEHSRRKLRRGCRFPVKKLNKYIDIASVKNIPFVVIRQTGIEQGNVMGRNITLKFMPYSQTSL